MTGVLGIAGSFVGGLIARIGLVLQLGLVGG